MGKNEQIIPQLTLKQWVQVTRVPFLTASLIPLMIGFAFAAFGDHQINIVYLVATLISALLLHLGANVINDYFDHLSGADEANQQFIAPFTGGSRSIQTGVINARTTRNIAYLLFMLSFLIGIPVLIHAGLNALWLGLFGLFSGYFYTAPPLRLAARGGLGEFIIGLNFGPLLVLGGYLALTGEWSNEALLVGLPIGFLVMAIIYINEFPDWESDRKVGKNTLVVVLGKEAARSGYFIILFLCYLSLIILVVRGLLPQVSLITLFSALLLKDAVPVVIKHYDSSNLIVANASTIRVHLVFGILLIASLLLEKFVL